MLRVSSGEKLGHMSEVCSYTSATTIWKPAFSFTNVWILMQLRKYLTYAWETGNIKNYVNVTLEKERLDFRLTSQVSSKWDVCCQGQEWDVNSSQPSFLTDPACEPPGDHQVNWREKSIQGSKMKTSPKWFIWFQKSGKIRIIQKQTLMIKDIVWNLDEP